MKQLLSLNDDFIINSEKSYLQKVNEKGQFDFEWTDDTQKEAKGRLDVSEIYFHFPLRNSDGYITDNYVKVYLRANDVITLAEKIKEIQQIDCVGNPCDLPF